MAVVRSKNQVCVPDNKDLATYVLQQTVTYKERTALVSWEDGRSYTYRQVSVSVQNLAASLWQHGLRKGEIVFCFLPNCIEYPIIFYGVITLGAIVTTCNPNFTVREMSEQMDDSKPKFIFTTSEGAEKMAGLDCNYIEKIFIVGGIGGDATYDDLLLNGERCEAPPKADINPTEDVAVMPYSSGTTGRPKGVLLTHYNYIAQLCALNHNSIQHLHQGREVCLGILPFFHLYGQITFFECGFFNGATIVVFPKFQLENTLKAIEQYKVTVFHLVPPIVLLLAKSPLVENYDISSVHTFICAAAPLSEDLTKQVQSKLPSLRSFRQAFGMTEGFITIMSGENCKHGSVGQLVPNVQMRVVDIGSGETVGVGQHGEVRLKAPTCLKGYLNNPKATEESYDEEGWFRTGDIGYYDEDYNVYIVDRLKEIIKYKGFQVSPAELEAVILTHEKVADVAVTSILDDEAGELPIAFVVKKTGMDIKESDIVDFVSERVVYYKRLRGGVVFVSDIPKSPSGKLLRRVLRDRARQKNT